MGRPVIDALSKTNHYTLRVLTRNAQGEQAKNLTKTYPNVELVEGNYADEQAVRKLLTSVYGVFCNTDCWNCGGFQNEVDYGKMIFDISKELNVKHFVYSSLDHTQKLMANHGGYRCYHYDGKALVAEYIESHDPNNSDQLTFTLPMADKPIVLVGIDDIAWFVKYSFENPDKSFGEIFYIAGDNITMNDLVRTFTEGQSEIDN
jgi:nucleoside-diphosphate-sugar epimerase